MCSKCIDYSLDRFLYFALCWLFISNLFISADCPMSEWSVWSQCSCESQRQQRYRVALVPVTRGQQCTPVETQSRSCSLSECGGEWIPVVKVLCDLSDIFIKKKKSQLIFTTVIPILFGPGKQTSPLTLALTLVYRLPSTICVFKLWFALWEAVRAAGPWRRLSRSQGVCTWLLLPTGESFWSMYHLNDILTYVLNSEILLK